VTAEEVFKRCPHADEGVLSQLRAQYVCEANLSRAATRFDLGTYIRASKAMRAAGPVISISVLADTMEAIIAAVYLDSGVDAARALILRALGPIPERITLAPKDAKTELQERIQSMIYLAPLYRVVESSGPAHSPKFVVEVSVGGNSLANGTGSSKKEAAQDAARAALALTAAWTKAHFEQELLFAKP
jgi:ribonuclease-3